MLERWARYHRHDHGFTLLHVLSVELNAGEHCVSVRFSNFEFLVAAQVYPQLCIKFTIMHSRDSRNRIA